MNEASNAKQQIVERIKSATNILVTVSNSPSVDELSAALGLTLLLNKLDKHATAVVSGDIPPAITFLDPVKTFENTIDSLRDFIIALDKEKADHLRYKVEGDVVKIFITPYRTTITSDDLEFSQGDYNVELVLALGVKNKDHLDAALAAHGKILHDATVATLTAGETASDLGSIDWHDDNASSLSEMLVSLSEALKADKPLLDEQTSTAFLTGIVAATDRFSNDHTSSRVMTMAAQLMAAGANQQLIAAKLQEAHEIGNGGPSQDDGTTDLTENKPTKLNKKATDTPKEETPKPDDGSLDVEHDNLEEVSAAVVATQQAQAAKEAEAQLAEQLEATTVSMPTPPTFDQIKQDLVTDAVTTPDESQPLRGAVHSSAWQADHQDEPMMGGTLNATAEEAAEETRRQEEDDRNRTILNHGEPHTTAESGVSTYSSSINGMGQDRTASGTNSFAEPSQISTESSAPYTSTSFTLTPPSQSLADIDAQNRATPAPEDHARAAVEAALNATPTTPPVNPFAPDTFNASVSSQPNDATPQLPPMPDFSTLPPLPPLPSFEQSLPQPPEQNHIDTAMAPPTLETPTQPPTSDPGQFRIPGQ